MIWVLVAALPIGVLIGMIGVGGLLLPAVLGQVSGDPHLAAGTSSFAFLFTGMVAAAGLARERRLERRTAVPLALGAAPGALCGSIVAGVLPGGVMVGLLALLCLASGVQNIRRQHESAGRRALPAAEMVAVGFGAGAFSALTGTGGPVVLVPILLALRVDLMTTLALALFSQVPIVTFAVIGYASAHEIEYAWGTASGVAAAAGALIGMRIAGSTHPASLRRLAAVVLLVTSAYLAWSLIE